VSAAPSFRNVVCLFLALCCVVSATTADKKEKEYAFVPDPDADGAAMLTGSTWVGLGPGFTLRLQRVDEAQRLAYIEKVTGVATDPFRSPPDQEPRFLSFLMQLENNGAGSLVFRSAQCWLVTNKAEHLNPVGMDTLRATFAVMEAEVSPAYERVGSAFLPTDHTLDPGESMAGLLVYNMVKPGTRRYKVDIQITTPSGDVVPVTAPYRRVKLERSDEP
jgi:hypothetical protein